MRTPIVYIEWVDAHNNVGWFHLGEAEKWAAGGDWWCQDVGFLIRETPRFLVFAQRHEPEGHANGDEQWGALHRIPKTWIRNKKVLGYMESDGRFVSVKPPSARRNRARKGNPNGRKGT
jgi:hypothetical protein